MPNFLKVKELVDAGTIGEIRFSHSPFSTHPTGRTRRRQPVLAQPEIAGGGHFFDLASHQLIFSTTSARLSPRKDRPPTRPASTPPKTSSAPTSALSRGCRDPASVSPWTHQKCDTIEI
ncbi:MAG: hypothetical protein R2856_06060 [Caldilineaceae bacterium]